MKIVSVCACTVGIAHTFMAKSAIEEEAKKRGWDYKVEAQGGYGIQSAPGYALLARNLVLQFVEDAAGVEETAR